MVVGVNPLVSAVVVRILEIREKVIHRSCQGGTKSGRGRGVPKLGRGPGAVQSPGGVQGPRSAGGVSSSFLFFFLLRAGLL